MFDLGYHGLEKRFSNKISCLPNKMKSNLESTQEKIEYNENHSKKRIAIEHKICRLKKFRILADMFRNKLKKYDKISNIVSGLINYRLINYRK